MKYSPLLIAAFFLISIGETFLTSCSNSSSNNTISYAPVGMTDTINGLFWSASSTKASVSEQSTVHLSGCTSNDSLILSFYNTKTGDVPITHGIYQTSQYLDTVDGTLHISINTSSHIEGTFVLHGADFQGQHPILITGGKFSANF